MPLLSTVLNYLRGESPKATDNNQTDKHDTLMNKFSSPDRSPRLLQKCNLMKSNSSLNPKPDNFYNLENEISKSKKRTRQHTFDEDDEVVTSSQKKRRIYFSTSNDVCSTTDLDEGWSSNEVNGDTGYDTVRRKIDDEYSETDLNVAKKKSTEDHETNRLENEIMEYERYSISNKKEIGSSTLQDDKVNTTENRKNENNTESNSICANDELIKEVESVVENMIQSCCPNELALSIDNTSLKQQEPTEVDFGVQVEGTIENESSTASGSGNEKVEETAVVEEMKHDENNNEQVSSSTCAESAQEEDSVIEEGLIAQQISEGFLTDSMLDQEKKLHQKHLEEEKEIVTQAMAEWEQTIEQQRYSRLQHLLERSNVYSSFLLQRIEKQKEENEKEKMRQEKKNRKERDEDEETPQTVPDTKRGRKAKGRSSYNITDYVDAEALRQSSKTSDAASGSTEKHTELAIGHTSKNVDSSQNASDGYKQPELLTGGSLRDYQIDGVEWLKVLFENGVNGILADEMGLGKTIQCIALLAHLIEMGVKGPFLVTAPLSTLPNWVSEFKRFTPTISAILYHGTPNERAQLRRQITKLKGDTTYKAFPVVITSYEIIIRDRRYLDKFMWKYVIVDEGHRIKNLKCKLLRELKAYPSANRLLLTGTPLQNNLSELWSLLNFLLPDIFNDLDSFQAWFDFSALSESDGNEKIIAQEREHHVLERLHDILTPFLLRRLKTDVSIDIPLKKEVVVYAPLTQIQQQWYKLFLDKTRLHNHFSKDNDETTSMSFSPSGRAQRRSTRKVKYEIFDSDSINYDDLMEILKEEDERKTKEKQKEILPETCERNIKLVNIIMQMRKICNHPYLMEYPLIPETQDYRIDEELITCCGKTLVLDQMMAALKERGHKVLLFSQMTKVLDILEDFCYLRKYRYSRIDGSTRFEYRQAQIDDFNNDPNVILFLLSTRAGGLGLNLTAADTVILYDSDWNPQQDLQAQDRCHRIGQTKPVVVYRFLTANTVDQRIVERAADKRKLEKMVIHKGKFKGVRDGKKLTTKEMLELLESSDHMDVFNTENDTNTQVLSQEQLNKLLDRSDLLMGATCTQTEEESKLFKVV